MDPWDGTPAMLVRWWILHSPFCRRKNQMQPQGRPLKISVARFFCFLLFFSFPIHCLGYDLGVFIYHADVWISPIAPKKCHLKVITHVERRACGSLESHFASRLGMWKLCVLYSNPSDLVFFENDRHRLPGASNLFQVANLSFVFYTFCNGKIGPWMKMVISYSTKGVSLGFCLLRTDVGTYEICQVRSMGKCRWCWSILGYGDFTTQHLKKKCFFFLGGGKTYRLDDLCWFVEFFFCGLDV